MSERFVVVGGGTMGVGIAYVAATAGYAVELVEVDPARAEAALSVLDDQWGKAVDRGRLTDEQAAAARAGVVVRPGLSAVEAGPAVLVEAVPERLELKRSVLAEAAALSPGLLGTNTSSISVTTLAEGFAAQDTFIGLHFFNPVWAMPLLEIVVGSGTSPQTVAAAGVLAGRLGKDAIVVRDAPGFATSRLGIALGLEAVRMVEDGVASPADIDKAMVLGYRHPMGPLELGDLVGLDVRLDIARSLQAAYGDRYAPPALLERMVAEGKLGRKSGQGFYAWVNGARVASEQ